jgi:hypothetical protein
MRLLEQVASIDDDVRELRRRRGAAFAQRNARCIRELQGLGLADPTLDPLLAANALSGMVSRMAYQVYVVGEAVAFERLVATVTSLWANALRLPQAAGAAPTETSAALGSKRTAAKV